MPTPVDQLVFNRGSLSYSQFFNNYGSAWACGKNTDGQLGIGSITDATSPTALSGHTWSKLNATYNSAGAIKSDGSLWTCGASGNGVLGYVSASDVLVFTQVGSATDWADVAFGENTGYGIKVTTGALWAWGWNSLGQYGDGTTTSSYSAPVSTGLSGVASVTGGSLFAIALKTNGTLYGAGANTQGQLGLSHTTSPITSWTQIGSATNWAQVSCGQDFCVAVRTDGTLWSWGNGAQYGTGTGSTDDLLVPTQLGTDTNWAEAWCGQYHVIARKTNGTIYSWGQGGQGRLAQGDETTRTTPTQIGSATDWVGVAASQLFTYAKTATTVYSSGFNADGALGLGDITQRLSLTALTTDFVSPNAPIEVVESLAATTDTDTRFYGSALTVTTDLVDAVTSSTYTMYLEAIGLRDSLIGGANTTASLIDSAALADVIQAAISQIVADSANGADTFSLGAALTLVDIADAVATQASTYNSVMLVAELIATLEAYNGADAYDVTESGALSDAYINRLQAITEILEQRHIDGFDTIEVHTFQLVTDTAATADVGTHAGSLISALLSDGVVATIHLYIGGEVFTGWVLNTDTLAPSEYQFVDRQFNSACKHGDRYLLAAEDGIYEFTDDTGVETVMTYIKTGKTDFGSDLKKRVVNSYMVYAASGDMVLKVTTSEFGNLVTRNYRVVAQADDTTDTRRIDIGKGIKSRYWQFELVGDGVDCDIDEIGMLPVVLSRRI